LNKGTTIDSGGADEEVRVRAPDLVGLTATIDLPLPFIRDLYRTGRVLSRPPYRAMFCRAKRARR
jgi:hypothetical protein